MSSKAQKTIKIAKLLASEDIEIVIGGVSPCFSPTSRTLYLPDWGIEDKTVSDALCGHEVGHALFTDTDIWNKNGDLATQTNSPGFMSIFNVIEDCQTDRAVCKKYPGFKRIFVDGYNSIGREPYNYFGIASKSTAQIQSMHFFDRLNLFTKLGSFTGISFSEAEQKIVDKVFAVSSTQEAAALAWEIYEKRESQKEQSQKQESKEDKSEEQESKEDKSEEQEQKDAPEKQQDEQPEDDEDSIDDEDGLEEAEEDDEAGQPETQDHADSKIDGQADSKIDGQAAESFLGDKNGDGDFGTQNSLTDNLRKMASGCGSAHLVRVHIPKHLNYARHFVNDYTTILEHFSKIQPDMKYEEIKARYATDVATLCSRFDMKKEADNFNKTRTSSTGTLDPSKLHSYLYNDDVFLRQECKTSNAESHSFIVFVDFSGSMTKRLPETIGQMIKIAMFFKRVGVPFEIYTFASLDSPDAPLMSSIGDACFGELQFLLRMAINKILTDGMNTADFKRMVELLDTMSMHYYRFGTKPQGAPSPFTLGSTPLFESTIVATEIAEKFNKRVQKDHLNMVWITDGEGNTNQIGVYSGQNERSIISTSSHIGNSNLTLRDKKTGEVYTDFTSKSVRHSLEEAALDIMKRRLPNLRLSGFFILSGEFSPTAVASFSNSMDVRSAFRAVDVKMTQDMCTDLLLGKVVKIKRPKFDSYFISYITKKRHGLGRIGSSMKATTISREFQRDLSMKRSAQAINAEFINMITL